MDVRDVGGRVRRFALACVIGVVGAVALARMLPQRDHFPDHWRTCFGGPVDIDFTLVGAGATFLTLVVYAALHHHARRIRVPTVRALRVRSDH
jgi:hypothetical protein